MKYWLSLVSCLLLLIVGCSEDPLLFRTSADYFPVALGNTWIYLQKGTEDTITVKVTDTTAVLAREAWVLERNGIPEYWWKGSKEVAKFYCETIFVNGVEDTIGIFWIPWLYTPLLLNEKWEHKFKQEKVILGDTVQFQIQVESKVAELKGSDYLVEIELIKRRKSNNFGSYCDTINYNEWYKPDIGIVKRRVAQLEEELISYSIH